MKKTILILIAVLVYATSFGQSSFDNENQSSNFTYLGDWQIYTHSEDTTGNYYNPNTGNEYYGDYSSYSSNRIYRPSTSTNYSPDDYTASYYRYNYTTGHWEKTDTIHYYTISTDGSYTFACSGYHPEYEY